MSNFIIKVMWIIMEIMKKISHTHLHKGNIYTIKIGCILCIFIHLYKGNLYTIKIGCIFIHLYKEKICTVKTCIFRGTYWPHIIYSSSGEITMNWVYDYTLWYFTKWPSTHYLWRIKTTVHLKIVLHLKIVYLLSFNYFTLMPFNPGQIF